MANYYYSWTLGSDSNTGTDFNNPRKSLQRVDSGNNASARLETGHNVFLAAGDIWPLAWLSNNTQNTLQTFGWAASAPGQILGAYDAGLGSDEPIIDNLLYIVPGMGTWSQSGNVWSIDVTTLGFGPIPGINRRVWPGLTGPSSGRNRTPLTWKSSTGAVTGVSQYAIVGTVLHVFSPSGNPAEYYGGLGVCVSVATGGAGAPSWGMTLTNPRNLVMRDRFTMRGMNGGIYLGTSTRDCRLTFNVENHINHGVIISHITAANNIYERLYIPDARVDYYTSLTEGYQGENQDAIAMTANVNGSGGYISDVEVVDFNCRGARHSAVAFQLPEYSNSPSYNTKRGFIMRSTRLGRSVIDCSEANYGRGITTCAVGQTITNIIITGQNVQTQIIGTGILSGIQWLNNRQDDPGATSDNHNTDGCLAIYGRDPNDAVSASAPNDIEVSGCLFDNSWSYPIRIGDTPAPNASVWPLNGLRIFGNTFIDLDHYSPRYVPQKTSANTPVTWSGTDTSCVVYCGAFNFSTVWPTMRDNVFVLPAGRTGIIGWSGVSGDPAVIRTYALNTGEAGGGRIMPVNERQYSTVEAMGVDSEYRPDAASPLYHAGIFDRYRTDGYGLPRHNPPSAGAYEPGADSWDFIADFGSGVFPDSLTHSRNSPATYWDRDGNNAYAPHNLALYSAIPDGAMSGGVGGTIASQFVSGITGSGYVYRTVATATSNITLACEFKAGTAVIVTLDTSGASTNDIAYFNLATATVQAVGSNNVSATIEATTDGYYLCSVTRGSTTVTGTGYVGKNNAAPGDTWYMRNLRSNVGPLQPYYPTTNAAYHGPRMAWDPTLQRYYYLHEAQAENGAVWSGAVDNAAWNSVNLAFIADQPGIGPSYPAQLAYPTTISSACRLQQPLGAYSGVYTVSVYAKTSGMSWIYIYRYDGAAVAAWFNISTGAVGTVVAGYTARIEEAPNGFWRCILTTPSGQQSFTGYIGISDANNVQTATPSGVNGVLFGGIQLEAGVAATSYIPTTTASVLRAADVCYLDVPTHLPGLSPTAATYYVEFQAIWQQEESRILGAESEIGGQSVLAMGSSPTVIQTYDGLNTNIVSGGNYVTSPQKTASTWRVGGSSLALSGNTSTFAANALVAQTRIYIGSHDGTTLFSSIAVKQIKIRKSAMTEAELIALTSG